MLARCCYGSGAQADGGMRVIQIRTGNRLLHIASYVKRTGKRRTGKDLMVIIAEIIVYGYLIVNTYFVKVF